MQAPSPNSDTMTIIATAATTYLASCRRVPTRLPFSGVTMTSSPFSSAAARNAADARIRHLSSSSSSIMHSSSSSSDINASTTSASSSSSAKPLLPPKRVLLLRHGQALHNPRAEAAREKGCDFDTFLNLMMEDDAFDAALTELGVNQAVDAGKQTHVRHALRNIEMVVSSPLSRALRTADLVHPPADATKTPSVNYSSPRRVCIEDFREINGKLLNAQRRHQKELEENFPHWNFGHIPAVDESWRPDELESSEACSNRGYQGLLWMMQQREEHILLVCHGGLLNYTMNSHSRVVLVDGRGRAVEHSSEEEELRCITKRFGNCEMREFIMTVWDSDEYSINDETTDPKENGESIQQPVITLEEVTMEMGDSYVLNVDGNDDKEKILEMM